MMKTADLKEKIKRETGYILPRLLDEAKRKVNGKPSYICPLPECGHGKNGDGITQTPRNPMQLHCFGCGFSGDIIDLYGKAYGRDFKKSLKELGRMIGEELEEPDREPFSGGSRDFHHTGGGNPRKEGESPAKRKKDGGETEEKREETAGTVRDFTEYIERCRENLKESKEGREYLLSRGITEEWAETFGLGYDPEADPAESGHPTPRVIIPTGAGHYIARATNPDTPKAFRVMNPKGTTPELWGDFDTDAPTFVVEGAFDAMSIRMAGANAMAINSTANIGKVAEYLKEAKEDGRKTPRVIILAMDNDAAGERASSSLAEMMKEMRQPFYIADDLCNGHKDANELLQKDAEGLKDQVAAFKNFAVKPDGIPAYLNKFFQDELEAAGKPLPTGMINFDNILGGGMRMGMNVLAAISSAGKTTLSLQLARGIARNGGEVLYVSLEQSRLELITKMMAAAAYAEGTNLTSTDILDKKGDPKVIERLGHAIVQETGGRLSLYAAPFGMTAADICGLVDEYERRVGTPPVVFIDYLQAISGGDTRQDYRRVVDDAVRMLAIKSKEKRIAIFLLSSLNRAAYKARRLSMESLKESGGIEYTADYIWGMTYEIPEAEGDMITEEQLGEARSANPRKMRLELIKGRGTATGGVVYLDYYAANDTFKEREEEKTRKRQRV